MSNQVALVSRNRITAIQEESVNAVMNNDLSGLLRAMADANDANQGRENQFQRAMRGEFTTVTALGRMILEEFGVRLTSPQLNNVLIDMGLQTRVIRNGSGNYYLTEQSLDLGAGQTVQIGDNSSIRWDIGVIPMIVDFMTKPEEADAAE